MELAKSVKDKLTIWENHFLKDAQKRLAKQIKGYDFTIRDAKDMMEVGIFSQMLRRVHMSDTYLFPASPDVPLRNCCSRLLLLL